MPEGERVELGPVAGHLALVPVADASANEARVRAGFWPKLKRVIARVPFVEELLVAYYCAIDPLTPPRVKGLLYAGLAYFVLPFDLLPDAIAGLGFTDDAAVLTAIIAAVSSHILPRHRERARVALTDTGAEPDPE